MLLLALLLAGQSLPKSDPAPPPPAADMKAEADEFFEQFDVNKDGGVTREEFADNALKHAGPDLSDEDRRQAEAGLRTAFTVMDSDGDGRITRAELEAVLAARDAG